MRTADLTGTVSGRITVEERADSTRHGPTWLCRCSCGSTFIALGSNIRRGGVTSCGCRRREKTVLRCTKHDHGRREQHSSEYRTWRGMIARCRNMSDPRYGGAGIRVCDRWIAGENGVHGFICFIEDMGPKPTARHSIERVDNGKGYVPNNCQWAEPKQQARNRRTSRSIQVGGRIMTIAEAAEAHQVNYATLIYRLDKMGMSPDQAVACVAA